MADNISKWPTRFFCLFFVSFKITFDRMLMHLNVPNNELLTDCQVIKYKINFKKINNYKKVKNKDGYIQLHFLKTFQQTY